MTTTAPESFQRFINQPVSVKETPKHLELSIGKFDFVDHTIEDNNPIIDEIRKEAEDAGLSVRIWLPGTHGTCDYDLTRLNVNIVKNDNGTFEIATIDLG